MARPTLLSAQAAVLLLFAVGCGYTETGTGTQTLQVNGSISYSPVGGNDRSMVSVAVLKDGAAITSAVVQVVDADSGEEYIVPSAGARYEGAWDGFHRRVAWRVIDGNDNVAFRLEGPGRHTVSAPAHGGTHSPGDALKVAWRTDDGVRGEEVLLRLTPGGYTKTLDGDDGNVLVAPQVLTRGPASISVLRRTHVVPAGAVSPSVLTSSYEVVNDFLIN